MPPPRRCLRRRLVPRSSASAARLLFTSGTILLPHTSSSFSPKQKSKTSADFRAAGVGRSCRRTTSRHAAVSCRTNAVPPQAGSTTRYLEEATGRLQKRLRTLSCSICPSKDVSNLFRNPRPVVHFIIAYSSSISGKISKTKMRWTDRRRCSERGGYYSQ